MKKGFTLIELLAVIVILAIIAIIATPIVLNIINETKASASERSIGFYLDAVELSIANSTLKGTKVKNGPYKIMENGNICRGKITDNKCSGIELEVEIDGEVPTGTVVIKDGKITNLNGAQINGKSIIMDGSEIKLVGRSKLLQGWAYEETELSVYQAMEQIGAKTVQFLSGGELPEGYALEELKKLDYIDVSDAQDKSILAYYDEDKNVYIYSENMIVFHENCNSMFMMDLEFNIESIDFGNVDTSNVTDMGQLVMASGSTYIKDISSFDTSNVEIMYTMFYGISNETLDLSHFNTSKVTDMTSMFAYSPNLKTINMDGWDTSNVTGIGIMFQGTAVEELDLSDWNTSSLYDDRISIEGAFATSALKKINLSGWYLPSSLLETPSIAFGESSIIEELDLSDCKLPSNTSYIGIGFLGYLPSLKKIDLSGWDVSNITDMSCVFSFNNSLEIIDLTGWDTSNVTNMDEIFSYNPKLKAVYVSSTWDTSNASTNDMFIETPISSVTYR